MRYKLSFGVIDIIGSNIAEVTVNQDVVMTLEMCEEYDNFLIEHFTEPFVLLINKIHDYSYTFEAKLHIASLEYLQAMAVITYNQTGKVETEKLINTRSHDDWQIKRFSGLTMGRQQALNWLNEILITQTIDN